MPPRKSTTRSQTQQQPHASSSKVTLDHLPVPELPESLTPEYRPDQRRRVRLNEEERGMLVHEVQSGSHTSAALSALADYCSSLAVPQLKHCWRLRSMPDA